MERAYSACFSLVAFPSQHNCFCALLCPSCNSSELVRRPPAESPPISTNCVPPPGLAGVVLKASVVRQKMSRTQFTEHAQSALHEGGPSGRTGDPECPCLLAHRAWQATRRRAWNKVALPVSIHWSHCVAAILPPFGTRSMPSLLVLSRSFICVQHVLVAQHVEHTALQR